MPSIPPEVRKHLEVLKGRRLKMTLSDESIDWLAREIESNDEEMEHLTDEIRKIEARLETVRRSRDMHASILQRYLYNRHDIDLIESGALPHKLENGPWCIEMRRGQPEVLITTNAQPDIYATNGCYLDFIKRSWDMDELRRALEDETHTYHKYAQDVATIGSVPTLRVRRRP